jgi:hypothetical protein
MPICPVHEGREPGTNEIKDKPGTKIGHIQDGQATDKCQITPQLATN